MTDLNYGDGRTNPAAEVAAAALRGELDDERPAAALRPGELITGAELDSLIEQSTAPLAAGVVIYRASLRTWAGRQPGGCATADERTAATLALHAIDDMLAELYVLRAKLVSEVRLNDERTLTRSAERGRVLDAPADPGAVCARCGTGGGINGVLVEASAAALDVLPGALVCHNRIACLTRRQRLDAPADGGEA